MPSNESQRPLLTTHDLLRYLKRAGHSGDTEIGPVDPAALRAAQEEFAATTIEPAEQEGVRLFLGRMRRLMEVRALEQRAPQN